MLIIKPVQEKSEQEEYCAECGAEFDADCLAYAAWVDEKLVGICQFALRSDGGHIVTMRPAKGSEDWDALFIMGRQTMNVIDLGGIHEAYYDDTLSGGMPEDFILRLGFLPRGGVNYVNLTGFFESPCSHGKAGSATAEE